MERELVATVTIVAHSRVCIFTYGNLIDECVLERESLFETSIKQEGERVQGSQNLYDILLWKCRETKERREKKKKTAINGEEIVEKWDSWKDDVNDERWVKCEDVRTGRL